MKNWKFLRKSSMMKLLSVKLQSISVRTATLLLRELIIDSFWNMYQKLNDLKNNILRKKGLWWTGFSIKLQPGSTQP